MSLLQRIRKQARGYTFRLRRTRKLRRETEGDRWRWNRWHRRRDLDEFRHDRKRFRRSRKLLHRSRKTLRALKRKLNVGGRGRARKLLARCRAIAEAGGPYEWGGGHGPLLKYVRARPGLDCSSSVSLALWRAGLFHTSTAIVSGQFVNWGLPGRGRFFTIHYNASHVWIEFHGLLRWVRFDTSPQGSGGRGPRLRFGRRFTAGFRQRHWPGL